jgi:hypothetical protein
MLDKVKNSSNSNCYTSSSAHFKIIIREFESDSLWEVSCRSLLWTALKLKLNYDQRSVDQSVCLGVGLPSRADYRIFIFWQLLVSWCGTPSLTRGWICNFLVQLLLGPTELTTIFYCLIWGYTDLGGQVLVFISQRKRVAQLYLPRALWSLFLASYDLQGYRGGILTNLHTGICMNCIISDRNYFNG